MSATGAGFAVCLGMLAAFAPSASAAGPTKQACIDADTGAQAARRAGKFSEALVQLRICTDAACPALVRSDCNQRMNDLAEAQPAVILVAKDTSGADLTDVAV